MGISAAGIGSNLDVDGIVSQLMAVERQPLTLLAKTRSRLQGEAVRIRDAERRIGILPDGDERNR